LERLEERHAVVNNVPEFVIVAVDGDGHVSGKYRLTPTGLRPLSPEEEDPDPDTTREDEGHRQKTALA
jgi:hypothetical protein